MFELIQWCACSSRCFIVQVYVVFWDPLLWKKEYDLVATLSQGGLQCHYIFNSLATAKKSRGEREGITRWEHLELERMVRGKTCRSREVKEEKLFKSQAPLEGTEQSKGSLSSMGCLVQHNCLEKMWRWNEGRDNAQENVPLRRILVRF